MNGKEIIKCDNCDSTVSKEIQKRTYGDIEITYLFCEECYSEYVITVTDSKLRQMINSENEVQEEIKRLHKASHEEYKLCVKQKQKNRVLKNTQKSQNKLMKKYEELKKKSKEYHDELKRLYC